MSPPDTIAAIATPPGRGGVGIVRISGSRVPDIAQSMLGALPAPRDATLSGFHDQSQRLIDQGIALYFPAPHSFTGESVLELHGHGGPVVLDMLLAEVLLLGARVARPGEFSERAFLNGKLDLTQAEAIADLIASTTTAQARLATRTLQGIFGASVRAILADLTELRVTVEALLDFPDEDIDTHLTDACPQRIDRLIRDVQSLLVNAQQGERIRDGLTVVIAGPPNVGKSSLLNALCGQDTAIVTAVPGTTRDLLRADIAIDELPLRLVDTAGLRLTDDPIETEGIRRARVELSQADLILWITDASTTDSHPPPADFPSEIPITYLRNKIDLTGASPTERRTAGDRVEILCSAATGAGLDLLRAHLKQRAGLREASDGLFSARRRHLDALQRTLVALHAAASLSTGEGDEMFAEELRQAQRALGEITGEFTQDDLLNRIFSGFCIGK